MNDNKNKKHKNIFYTIRTVPNTIEKWQNQRQSNNTNTSMYT